jgi:hypothetical protein
MKLPVVVLLAATFLVAISLILSASRYSVVPCDKAPCAFKIDRFGNSHYFIKHDKYDVIDRVLKLSDIGDFTVVSD